MTFKELQKVFLEHFGSDRPADIAKEFEVSSQVVGNWKQRDQVPYKYAKILREKTEPFVQRKTDFQEVVKDILTGGGIQNSNRIKNEEEPIINILENYFHQFYGRKHIILIWFFICFIFGLYYLLTVTPTFVSTAKILPISTNAGSSVNGIAAQFGFDLKKGNNDLDLSSSEMIPDLIKSRRLAKELLFAKFETKKYGSSRSLIHILSGTKNDSVELSPFDFESAVNHLSRSIKIERPARASGLLLITVSAFEPKLAMDIVNEVIFRLKGLTNSFRLNRLQQKESFIRNRLNTVKNDLAKSEDQLTKFRQKNRNIEFSPALMLSQERLVRDGEVQKEIYITLKNQYEIIQIEMVGMANYIQVLDEPELPLSRTSPSIKATGILIVFLATIFGFSNIFLLILYGRIKKYFF